MKLRYYLRGLGIGILVTALIMGIASSQKKMSDEEVRARAKELGMVESTTLSNINIGNVAESQPEPEPSEIKPEETKSEETKPVQTEPVVNKPEETTPTDTKPTETIQTDSKPSESKPEESKPTETTPTDSTQDIDTPVDTNEMITIVVKKGDSSVSVSKDLAEAGLVEGAASFDKYLCANGYDKKISVGTYHIPMGASEEDIAKVITGKKSFE